MGSAWRQSAGNDRTCAGVVHERVAEAGFRAGRSAASVACPSACCDAWLGQWRDARRQPRWVGGDGRGAELYTRRVSLVLGPVCGPACR